MNRQFFSKDDVLNGAFDAFLKALIAFGVASKSHYNDIHIVNADDGAVDLEWEEVSYSHREEEGEFVFLEANQAVFKEVLMPDGSSQYVMDDGDEAKLLKEWLKLHPEWQQDSATGCYYKI